MTGMAPAERLEAIRSQLTAVLQPHLLEVEDESHLHIGHAGARDGRGHFHVRIACLQFDGLSRLARHRLVNDALAKLLVSDIHALRITTEV